LRTIGQDSVVLLIDWKLEFLANTPRVTLNLEVINFNLAYSSAIELNCSAMNYHRYHYVCPWATAQSIAAAAPRRRA
jgi:hypothetical protein